MFDSHNKDCKRIESKKKNTPAKNTSSDSRSQSERENSFKEGRESKNLFVRPTLFCFHQILAAAISTSHDEGYSVGFFQ